MDFIERWLGVSPDGGNGAMEMLIVAAIAIGVVVCACGRRLVRLAWQVSKRREAS
jgi:hypothetical protein